MKNEWTLSEGLVVPERASEFPNPGESLPTHWAKCFGCGDEQSAGMHMQFIAGKELDVVGRLVVDKKYQGGPGVIHGGVIASAFDEAQGMACTATGETVVTAHLSIDYSKPVPLGSVVQIHAQVDGVNGRKIFTRAEAIIIEGPNADPHQIVASSHALFLSIDFSKHFSELHQFIDKPETETKASSLL